MPTETCSTQSPYAAPSATGADTVEKSTKPWWYFEAACFVVVAIFVGSACLHCLQKSAPNNAYRTSFLIPIELFSFLPCFLIVPALALRAIYFLFLREWKLAGIVTVLGIIVYLALSFGMWVDASTLIYMT